MEEENILSNFSYRFTSVILFFVEFSDIFFCVSSQLKMLTICCVYKTILGTIGDKQVYAMKFQSLRSWLSSLGENM